MPHVPCDQPLYEQVKREVVSRMANSAYRSGHIVRKYKQRFAQKHGKRAAPYKGSHPKRATGLGRWFAEEWRTQDGRVGYSNRSDVYRPTIRINPATPVTHEELTKAELRRARREKRTTGRVRRFRRPQTGEGEGADTFSPNLTPRQMFSLGSFGGTYWRPIYSAVTRRDYRNVHHRSKIPPSWWKGIPESSLSRPFDEYDTGVNRYKVRVGTTLQTWEDKGWISAHDPYGWVQWYCHYLNGRRLASEDERQIGRWQRLAGPNGRFRRRLVSLIMKHAAAWDDESVSPRIRQTLQHWAYRLTKKDFDADLRRRDPADVQAYRQERERRRVSGR